MTLVVHSNDLTVTVLKMYKEAAVLSALLKMCTIRCHDRGHINGMFVLQSCTDSLHILPVLSTETFPTSSDGACNFSNTEVEEDVEVKEEGFIAVKEEADICITQKEICEDMKSEPDKVSYVCVCMLLDTFYQCTAFPVSFLTSVFLATCKSSTGGDENNCLYLGVCVCVC